MSVTDLSSGKGDRDENFPVASILISKRFRPPILAFYKFARAADDVADHPTAPPEEKLRLLDQIERTLMGELDVDHDALELRHVLAAHGLSPQHPLMLLEAFRRDVTKSRTADWDDLMDYCRYSAMPVGRFVLDVHGESRDTWPANDALCAALQVINHLQDCAKDFRDLDRVYLPLDLMARHDLPVEALRAAKSSPALRAVLDDLAHHTAGLLETSRPFAGQIKNRRLSLNVAVIQTLAEDLDRLLLRRDPLCDPVHHGKSDIPRLFLRALGLFASARLRTKRSAPRAPRTP